MLKQAYDTATVIKTDGSRATVVINKNSSCRECGKAQAGICGKGGGGMLLSVRNDIGAKQGDTVVVSLDRKTHFKAYLFAFIMPVIALFGGTYAGSVMSGWLVSGDLDVFLGLVSLILGIIFSLKMIHTLDRTEDMYISRIIYDGTGHDISPSAEGEEYLRAFAHK